MTIRKGGSPNASASRPKRALSEKVDRAVSGQMRSCRSVQPDDNAEVGLKADLLDSRVRGNDGKDERSPSRLFIANIANDPA